MKGERFQFLCHTCGEDKLLEEFELAQDYFNEHADRGCEVVLERAEIAAEFSDDETPRRKSESENPRATNE